MPLAFSLSVKLLLTHVNFLTPKTQNGGRDYLLQSIMHEWTYLYSLSDNLAQLRLRFFPSYGHKDKVEMFLGPHITKVESRKIN